jgi:hypothetical protein
MYRFCKIVIQPETVISTEVHSTVSLTADEIEPTLTVEQEAMKFT